MKTSSQILISLFVCPAFISSTDQKEEAQVIFRIYSPALKPADTLFIAGNQESPGLWHPGKKNLAYNQEGFWEKHLKFPQGTLIEYKFARDSWDNEALDSAKRIYSKFSPRISGDTVIKHILPFWKNGSEKPITGQITGTGCTTGTLEEMDCWKGIWLFGCLPDTGKIMTKDFRKY